MRLLENVTERWVWPGSLYRNTAAWRAVSLVADLCCSIWCCSEESDWREFRAEPEEGPGRGGSPPVPRAAPTGVSHAELASTGILAGRCPPQPCRACWHVQTCPGTAISWAQRRSPEEPVSYCSCPKGLLSQRLWSGAGGEHSP